MKHDQLQEYISFRVRECRKERNLSQEKLSELAGLGAKAIQNIETLKYDFKVQTLEKVLGALDISVEDFFNFPFSESKVSLETLNQNILSLSDEKKVKLISSFNEIVKNID
ncbi:helix-turn-helix domain-containing protein [Streptococcus ruminantium]|uniref:helix-turn-helix domain-containing protein n=1 Tax=Streptococcus ruminantium TaxID=1917441 RepID=UPI0012DD3122|nr:helix-turn-helix transcriptional regulator [Streptococcus ruminantium]